MSCFPTVALCFVVFLHLHISTTITMARTKQTAKKSTGGPRVRQRLATMRAKNAPRSPSPDFVSLIPPSRHQLTEEQVKNYKFLTFDQPELRSFDVGDEVFTRYRVSIKGKNGKVLGLLPLPIKYHDAWVQMCYNVVYNRNAFRILGKLRGDKDLNAQERACAGNSMKSAGAALRHYLWARRHIVLELLSHGGSSNWLDADFCLPKFNEYIIKERFDYHWEKPQREHLEYFEKDALSKDMKKEMSQ
jgi:hypothetical protein